MSAITKFIRRTLAKTLGDKGKDLSKKITLYMTAKKEFAAQKTKLGSFRDYKKALRRHFVSYNEYMMFKFYEKTEEERDKYIADYEVFKHSRNLPTKIEQRLFNKALFLKSFSKYIHRQWLCVPEATFEEFVAFSKIGRCLSKKIFGTFGVGIEVLDFSKYNSEEKLHELYEQLKNDDKLLEEIIVGNEAMQTFHPQSLNTIRVITLLGKNGPVILDALFRVGVGGNIVDNTYSGGLYAMINVETGIIDSDGVDKYNNYITEHPNSKLKFKGFQIPDWDKIKQTCLEATMLYAHPNLYMIGWDVVVNAGGQIEFVEGNNCPSMISQGIRQRGVKPKMKEVIPGFFNLKKA